MNKRYMQILKTAILLALPLVAGCGRPRSGGDSLKVINLETAISEKNMDLFDREGWEVMSVVPEVTDSTQLGQIRVSSVGGSSVLLFTGDRVLDFDFSGKCRSILSRQGEGPGEYTGILEAASLPSGDIALIDAARNAMKVYTRAGQWKSTVKTGVSSVLVTRDGVCMLSYPPATGNKTEAYWTDGSLSVTDSLTISAPRETSRGFVFVPSLQYAGEEPCVLLSDTVFSLSGKGCLRPEIVFNAGTLSLPPEIEDDFTRRDERKHYISGLYPIIWNDYVFLSYCHEDKMFFDVWDIQETGLKFRNTMSCQEDKYGMPVSLDDGRTVRMWPQLACDGKLVGLVMSEFQDGGEEADWDSNPEILIISRKGDR